MARQPTELEVLIKTTGTEKLRGLTSSLKRLKDTTTITATSTGKLTDFIKRNSQQQQKSINGTAALANSYRQLARNVDFTSNVPPPPKPPIEAGPGDCAGPEIPPPPPPAKYLAESGPGAP